jgi:RND family efflux transporter MFP subunit
MSASRTGLLLLFSILFSTLLFAQTGPSITLSAEAKKNLRIELAAAQARDIYDTLSVRGMLREQMDGVAWVSPTASGHVARVLVKEADKVANGDVLLLLHAPELEKLRTELALGLDRETMLQAELERVRPLVEKHILSSRDLMRLEAEAAIAGSKVEAARRGIYLLGLTEPELEKLLKEPDRPAYLPLHAPIKGYITERSVNQGEMVEPSRRLFKIMDTSVLWAEGDVFEMDVPKVRTGQEVSLVLRPFAERQFAGVIKAISADLHPQKRTAHLWIEVPNPDEYLKPQMAVDITILLSKKAKVLAVPKEAVIEEGGETFVFVTNGDAFLEQRVVLGSRDNRYCEVREGIYEGDQVVVKGNHELRLAISSQGPGRSSDGHLHQ